MDHWSVPFINREEELETIKKHLLLWKTRHVIFIWGEGGIGKTRLLNEVEQRFAGIEMDFPVKIPPIVDFDDDRYKQPRNIEVSIARQLDPYTFDVYLEALRELRLAEASATQSDSRVRRKLLEVKQLFVECFNKVSDQRRIVLRVDTTDTLQSTSPITHILDEMATRLHNVLILIAGRNVEQLYKEHVQEMEMHAVPMPLLPFTTSDSRSYLRQKQEILKITLESEWMDKLFILAGGLPVLIDLAIEWAQNHRALPGMDELSLSELEHLQQQALSDKQQAKQDLQHHREEFKRTTVKPIANLRSDLDYLKLVLSKVYPLDIEGVAEMLNLSLKDATQLVNRARLSVTIKTLPDGRIKLHDEVQRLINKYIWLEFDPQKEWQRRDLRRAMAYLKRKSDALLNEIRLLKQSEHEAKDASDPSLMLKAFVERQEIENEFWFLRTEFLRLQIIIDVQTGYELFEHELEFARTEATSASYHDTLLRVIETYADWDSPTADIDGKMLKEDQQLAIQNKLALDATFSGRYRRADKIYQRLLEKLQPGSKEYIKALNGQTNQLIRVGKLQQARRINEQALEFSKQLGSQEWIIKSTVVVGWMYRLTGHLDQAIQHYDDALRRAIGQNDQERIALTYGQLAYVHALQHQDKALGEIQRAIRMWRRLVQEREENRFELGRCYNIAGEIHLEMEHPDDALNYFSLSWDIFSHKEREDIDRETPISEWKSKSHSGRGFAYWQIAEAALKRGDKASAQHNLQEALDYLEWAAEHATEFDSPIIQNRLGEVHFLLKDYPATEKAWLQSAKEARQVGDAFSVFHSMSDLARLTFYHSVEQYPTWQDFERWYRRDYRRRFPTTQFDILDGLFYTNLGHLALKNEEVKDAIRLYERGLFVLTQRGTFASFNLLGQLDFIENKILPHISPASIRQVGDALKQTWIAREYDVAALAYFHEWDCWVGANEQATEVNYV